MAVTEAEFAGSPVAMTDGKVKVTFDHPEDFTDWLSEHADANLLQWHWCQA